VPDTGQIALDPGQRQQGALRRIEGSLSVGVMVDLEWSPSAGGHVKCWERFADAALAHPEELDLTIYFLGAETRVVSRGKNVRFVLLPPSIGTRNFQSLEQGAGHTDIGLFHRSLAHRIREHDVLHTTGAFNFSQTARRVSRNSGKPLVSSLHTDLAAFAQHYSREIIARWFSRGRVRRLMLDELHLDKLCGAAVQWHTDSVLRASRHILASVGEDRTVLAERYPNARISTLRRGIDKTLFRPRAGARALLSERYGVPADLPIILFAGRVDGSKRVRTLMQAVNRLNRDKTVTHLMIVGAGEDVDEMRRLGGDSVTLTGPLPQGDLPEVYAGADIFAFPSESEVVSNVVLEAKASGLPVVVADHPGTGGLIADSGADGVVVGERDPDSWAAALTPLVEDPALRSRLGRGARQWAEMCWPDWSDVFAEDLLSVWRAVQEASDLERARPATENRVSV
jgi:glycosyltransferase involved in cell wall biosynthesis